MKSLVAAMLVAQVSWPPAALVGTVRDVETRDGWIAGATVVVTNIRTGATTTVVTSADGSFEVLGIEPGNHSIAVSSPGYGSLVSRRFCVEPGRPTPFKAVLSRDARRSGARPQAGPPVTRAHGAAVNSPVVTAPAALPAAAVLSPAEVEEAMAFGRRHPKLVGHPLKASGSWQPRRAGMLFTPFWRVATMTQVAAARDQRFTSDDIPAAVREQTIWIVGFGNEYRFPEEDSGRVAVAPVTTITIRPPGAKNVQDEIQPAWTMVLETPCDLAEMEPLLGPQLAVPALMAAFPAEALRTGSRIVFRYHSVATPPGTFRGFSVKAEERTLKISDRDLRDWR
ncbi:MAG TPA: carboxypeptidase-like regulatory domain-containing protein [Vicinamibacterales bacterium]|nr:carboxypeptidase-like regulatory domain-containing protein [Vicinamibacterales bacterium]